MAAKKRVPRKAAAKAARKPTKEPAKGFQIEGQIRLETLDTVPEELELTAYAYDEAGQFLASAPVGDDGGFEVPLPLRSAEGVQIYLAPKTDPEKVRRSAAYSRKYAAEEWAGPVGSKVLKPRIYVIKDLWRFWWPQRICVSGHVRNRRVTETGTTWCPVPYAKVEVYDVDREGCWWPYIYRLKDQLKYRRLVLAEDLLANRVPTEMRVEEPFLEVLPEPGPGPDPVTCGSALGGELKRKAFNPQPEPPAASLEATTAVMARSSAQPVGEVASLSVEEARSLEHLNINSRLAPWVLFPWCFYSREKMCQDFTDCSGYFKCCFWWWPLHWRRGRLRLDLKPDIVLRVTQVIDGVETVIYVDPYSSTRWNVGSTHIDLWLDDERVVCGPGCTPGPDLGTCNAALLQLGKDELWKIDRANGLYTVPDATNGAYGFSLVVRGDFDPDFKDGAPPRYYLLSWAKATAGGGVPPDADFKPVQTTMEAYRAVPGGTFHSYLLGPKPSGPVEGLYEVQDTAHWWIPKNLPLSTPGGMVLGIWPTRSFEDDEGVYWLRMEVFAANGAKLNTARFCNYQGDGSGAPVPPTSSIGKLDIKVHVDNQRMTFDLVTPATNDCGVVPWAPTLTMKLTVKVNQANGRVHEWWLRYNKGIDPTRFGVTPGPSSESFSSGTATVDRDAYGDDMLTGLTTTCAFGIHLRAWSHVRVNHGWHYYGEKSYAIAVEKCPPCPPCPET